MNDCGSDCQKYLAKKISGGGANTCKQLTKDAVLPECQTKVQTY
jgi:hypothetical protein